MTGEVTEMELRAPVATQFYEWAVQATPITTEVADAVRRMSSDERASILGTVAHLAAQHEPPSDGIASRVIWVGAFSRSKLLHSLASITAPVTQATNSDHARAGGHVGGGEGLTGSPVNGRHTSYDLGRARAGHL